MSNRFNTCMDDLLVSHSKMGIFFDVFAHSWLTIYPLQIRNAEYNIVFGW